MTNAQLLETAAVNVAGLWARDRAAGDNWSHCDMRNRTLMLFVTLLLAMGGPRSIPQLTYQPR